MASAEVPQAIRKFLLEYVHTYEQLETLLLLHDHEGRTWTADAVADALKISASSAAETLQELTGRSLLESEPTSPLSYGLSRSEATGIVQSIAHFYKENRLLIMELMNANAIERMRTGALRAFSNAFVISRKKKDG